MQPSQVHIEQFEAETATMAKADVFVYQNGCEFSYKFCCRDCGDTTNGSRDAHDVNGAWALAVSHARGHDCAEHFRRDAKAYGKIADAKKKHRQDNPTQHS